MSSAVAMYVQTVKSVLSYNLHIAGDEYNHARTWMTFGTGVLTS